MSFIVFASSHALEYIVFVNVFVNSKYKKNQDSRFTFREGIKKAVALQRSFFNRSCCLSFGNRSHRKRIHDIYCPKFISSLNLRRAYMEGYEARVEKSL